MKICVVGGTGKIGTNLIPMLVGDKHQITVISSGQTARPAGSCWDDVTFVKCSYGEEEWVGCLEEQGCEVLIDIIGNDAPATYAAVHSTCKHYVLCGSTWMFGPPRVVPTPEHTQGPCLFEGHRRRYKDMLAMKTTVAADGNAFSAIMPPNICGPGRIPLEGHGGRSLDVHKAHQRGEPVALPHNGTTLIGPGDIHDVAMGFYLAVNQRDAAAGEIFNVGSNYALTAEQFVQTYGDIYGITIPVEICSWQTYSQDVVTDPGANYHFKAQMCPDLSKINSRLGYQPRYTPEQTMARAVAWMQEQNML